MRFSEFEYVHLIEQVIGVLNDEDIAREGGSWSATEKTAPPSLIERFRAAANRISISEIS